MRENEYSTVAIAAGNSANSRFYGPKPTPDTAHRSAVKTQRQAALLIPQGLAPVRGPRFAVLPVGQPRYSGEAWPGLRASPR